MVPLHFTLLSKLIIKSQSAQVMGTLQVISCCLERSSDTAYSWDVLRQRISSYPLSAQGTLPGISQSAEGRAWLSLPSQHAVTLPSAQPGASSGVLKCLCMQLSHWMGTQGFVLVELRCWSGTCRQNAHEAAKISGHRGRQHTTAVLNTTWGKTSLDPWLTWPEQNDDLQCPAPSFIRVQGSAHTLGSCVPTLSMPSSSPASAKCTHQCWKVFQHPTHLLLWELLPAEESCWAGKGFSCSNSRARRPKRSPCQPPASYRHNCWSSWNHQPSVLGIRTQTDGPEDLLFKQTRGGIFFPLTGKLCIE